MNKPNNMTEKQFQVLIALQAVAHHRTKVKEIRDCIKELKKKKHPMLAYKVAQLEREKREVKEWRKELKERLKLALEEEYDQYLAMAENEL